MVKKSSQNKEKGEKSAEEWREKEVHVSQLSYGMYFHIS